MQFFNKPSSKLSVDLHKAWAGSKAVEIAVKSPTSRESLKIWFTEKAQVSWDTTYLEQTVKSTAHQTKRIFARRSIREERKKPHYAEREKTVTGNRYGRSLTLEQILKRHIQSKILFRKVTQK